MSGRIPRKSVVNGGPTLPLSSTPLQWDAQAAMQEMLDQFTSSQRALTALREMPDLAKGSKPLNAQQVANHPNFVKNFHGIVDFIDLKAKELKCSVLASFPAVQKFAVMLQRILNENELKSRAVPPLPEKDKGRSKTPKSKAIVPSSDEESDGESVQIVEADITGTNPTTTPAHSRVQSMLPLSWKRSRRAVLNVELQPARVLVPPL
ncbi:hypothetical protein L218DRAFT_1006407 [Marasmius fiardii PR-910]|nr:hypothetical protein L218DRAFT_1006407 [Marasmius fiardii PR-910]